MKNIVLGLLLLMATTVIAQKNFKLQVEKDQEYTSIKEEGTKLEFDDDRDVFYIDLPFDVEIGTSSINKIAFTDNFEISLPLGVRDSFVDDKPFDVIPAFLPDGGLEFNEKDTGSGIYFKKDKVNDEDVFTIEWHNIVSYDNDSSHVNFQVKFHKETKAISYSYGAISLDGEAIGEGVLVGLVSQYYQDDNNVEKAANSIFLSGDPGKPMTHLNVNFEDDPQLLMGVPSPGTVYTFTFEETSSIDHVREKELSFNVQPNPTSDVFSLGTEPVEEITMIRIVDMNGRVVQVNHSSFDAIDVSAVAPGTYIVEITTTQGTVNSRLVIAQK